VVGCITSGPNVRAEEPIGDGGEQVSGAVTDLHFRVGRTKP
jgi:hypothetical protein